MTQTLSPKTFRVCERCWLEISKEWNERLELYASEGRNDISPPPKCFEIPEPYRIRTCDFCLGDTIWSMYTVEVPPDGGEPKPAPKKYDIGLG